MGCHYTGTIHNVSIIEIERCIRSMATRLAKQFNLYQEREDLHALGWVTLLELHDRYDPRGGATFLSFAYKHIWGTMHRFCLQTLREKRWSAEYERDPCVRMVSTESAENHYLNLEQWQHVEAALCELSLDLETCIGYVEPARRPKSKAHRVTDYRRSLRSFKRLQQSVLAQYAFQASANDNSGEQEQGQDYKHQRNQSA